MIKLFCVVFTCLLFIGCVSVQGVPTDDNVLNSEFFKYVKSLNLIETCPHNALINSSVTDIVKSCGNLDEENKFDSLKKNFVTDFLLCVAYYDMNVRLCNISLSNELLHIPSDSVMYNKLLSSVNNAYLKANFCRDINEVLNDSEPTPLASNYTSILNGQFLVKDNICHKVCFNFDDSDVDPICKLILWGNIQINSILGTYKKVKTPVINQKKTDIDSNKESQISKLNNAGKSKPLNTPTLKAVDNNEAIKTSLENADKKVNFNKAAPSSEAQQPPLLDQDHTKPALKEQTAPLKLEKGVEGDANQLPESKKPASDANQLPESKKQTSDANINSQSNVVANPDNEIGDETEQLVDASNDDNPLEDNQEFDMDIPTPLGGKKETPVIGNVQVPNGNKFTSDVKETVEDKLEETPLKSDDIEDVHNPVVYSKNIYVNPSEGHFYTLFFTMIILSVVLYVAYHNKNKILGLIIEGRHKSETRRSSSGPAYRRLDNLEQVVSSGVKTPPSNVIY